MLRLALSPVDYPARQIPAHPLPARAGSVHTVRSLSSESRIRRM